jgi:hypothetical protein
MDGRTPAGVVLFIKLVLIIVKHGLNHLPYTVTDGSQFSFFLAEVECWFDMSGTFAL